MPLCGRPVRRVPQLYLPYLVIFVLFKTQLYWAIGYKIKCRLLNDILKYTIGTKRERDTGSQGAAQY